MMNPNRSFISISFILAPPMIVFGFIVWFTLHFSLLSMYEEYEWFIILWLLGVAVLLIELFYTINYLIVATFNKPRILTGGKVNKTKYTAVIFVVRNSRTQLKNNILYTLTGNQGIGLDYWLLSDRTDKPHCLQLEKQIILKLRGKLNYYHRNSGIGWKRGIIDEWLQTEEGKKYDYIVVCDADTILPPKTVNALLEKAEAPENSRIAIFQSLIIANVPPKTFFAKWLQPNQELTQRIYARASQIIFGQAMSFGSGNLIRANCYRSINLPTNALSHDIWDTVLLEEQGWKTAFCEDIITYEQYPNDYPSAIHRERRWLVGTLQALPLIRYRNLNAGTRFQILRSTYLYLLQPFFLLWIFLGPIGISQAEDLFSQVISLGPLLYTPTALGITSGVSIGIGLIPIWLGQCFVLVWSRYLPNGGDFTFTTSLSAIFWSTVLFMNNVVYLSATVFMMPFVAFLNLYDMFWQPTGKEYNPLKLSNAFLFMLLPTLLGAFGLWIGWENNQRWFFAALPVLLSFTFSSPIVYRSSRLLENSS